jgi:hypothetical protein
MINIPCLLTIILEYVLLLISQDENRIELHKSRKRKGNSSEKIKISMDERHT